jgi:hypothetical protein
MAKQVQLPRITARSRSHKSSQSVVNARFYSLLGVLLFAASAGLLSMFAWFTNTSPVPNLLDAQPKGKAVAELTAAAVLAGRPLPVPLSSTVSTSDEGVVIGNGTSLRAQDLVWAGFTPDVTAGIPLERHNFEFIVPKDLENSRSGVWRYRLVIVVLVPQGDVPMLGALPYIESASDVSTRLPFDYGAASGVSQVPDTLRSRLADWASFWAGDDRARLQSTTGDSRTTVEYEGLGGFSSTGISVLAALPQESGNWLLRVRVALTGPNGFGTEVDMDVTVSGVDQASPQVVAWGPAGSGVLVSGHNSRNKA